MFRRLLSLIAIILFSLSLHADDFMTLRITADSDPLSTVGGCVNALSGTFFYQEQDIVSQRAGGLSYSRVYDSASRMNNVNGHSWGSGFSKYLYFLDYKKGDSRIYVGRHENDKFLFNSDKKDENRFLGVVDNSIFKLGYTNTAETILMNEPPFLLTKVSCDRKDNKERK
jgi:hypothetical protein